MPAWEVNEGLTAEDWGIPRYWVQAGLHDPEIVMSRFDFAYDEVQTAFMQLTGADTSDVGASMVANEAAIEADGSRPAQLHRPGIGAHASPAATTSTGWRSVASLLSDWLADVDRRRRRRRRRVRRSAVDRRRRRPADAPTHPGGFMSLVDQAEFHFFHFFPYTNLPSDHARYESLWVDFPNSNYDPQTGHDLYTRYLSEMVLADRLGFDGLVLNEHHNTQYSMNPAPNLTAAALIPQTKGTISVFGTPPNLGYPNRLAEEYAMLDIMSGGRLRIAFPLGTGMEYWANAVNPATARARFRESIDVILRCWTEDGPQSYAGDFYTYRYLNPWPKPMQKPHPECYIVGTGSPETIELAAELGFGYTVVFIPTKAQLKVFEHFRERLAHHGHEPTPDKVTVGVMAYVAETDAKAEEEFMPHVMYFFENALRTTPRYLNPPGYVTVPEFRKRIQAADVHGTSNWDDLVAINRIVAGTPEKVADAIGNWLEEAGSSRVNLNLTLGDMPNWKVVKNTTLFAEEVIPIIAFPGHAGPCWPLLAGARRSHRSTVPPLRRLEVGDDAGTRVADVRRQRHQDGRPGGG